MRILHLSDTHLTRAPGPDSDGVDTRDSLRRVLHDCRAVPGLNAVVVTGDIADDGSREAYTDALHLIGAFARQRHIPAIFTTGNHDERAAFTAVLGSGHLDAEQLDRQEHREHQQQPKQQQPNPDAPEPGPEEREEWRERDGQREQREQRRQRERQGLRLAAADGECAAVTMVAGYRIITLDSLVPGRGYGKISTGQLAWLRGVLTEPSPHGSVLAFHHPPVVVPGVAVQSTLGLRNGQDLADAISGTDVRLVLCGHFHLQLFGMLAGVPVWVTPGVVTRIDLTAAPGTERAVKGASASLIDLGGPHSPVFHTLHARDPQIGQTAYEIDAAELDAVIARLGPAA